MKHIEVKKTYQYEQEVQVSVFSFGEIVFCNHQKVNLVQEDVETFDDDSKTWAWDDTSYQPVCAVCGAHKVNEEFVDAE